MLLLLTIGLASALVASRERLHHVELDEARVYGMGALRARLPAGWDPIPETTWPAGIVAARGEPVENGRKIFLFRGVPEVEARMVNPATSAIVGLATALVPVQDLGIHDKDPGPIGALPGRTVGLLLNTGTMQLPRATYCLGRAAETQAGEMIGVLLVLPDQTDARPWDQELLNRVSGEIGLLDE